MDDEIREQCEQVFPWMYYYSYLKIIGDAFIPESELYKQTEKWAKLDPNTIKVPALYIAVAKHAKKVKDIVHGEYAYIQKRDDLNYNISRGGHKDMQYTIPIYQVQHNDSEMTFNCPLAPVGIIENLADMEIQGIISTAQISRATNTFVENLNRIMENKGQIGEAFVYDEESDEDIGLELGNRCKKYIDRSSAKLNPVATPSTDEPAYTCGDVGKAVALAHFIALETYILKDNENNVCQLFKNWIQELGESRGSVKACPKLVQLLFKDRQIQDDLQKYNPECIRQVHILHPMVIRAWQDIKRYQVVVYEVTNPNNRDEKVYVMINATPGFYVLNKMLADDVLSEDSYRKSQESCIAKLRMLIREFPSSVGGSESLCENQVEFVEFSAASGACLATTLYERASIDCM